MQLWASGIHEARILSGLVDEPEKVTGRQMDKWAKDFDSWDICDQVCGNLFDRTPYAWAKAVEWSNHKKEFIKRAGFVLMATLAVHDKKAADLKFIKFFPLIKRGAVDERNFVKKAVNWAIRQIGKRFYFYQLPFWEKNSKITRTTDPYLIKSVNFLSQSPKTQLKLLNNQRIILSQLLPQVTSSKDDQTKQLELLTKFINSQVFYQFEFSLNKQQVIEAVICCQ